MAANKDLSPEQRMSELDKIFSDPKVRRTRITVSLPGVQASVEQMKGLSPEQRIRELDRIFSDPQVRRHPERLEERF